MSKSIDLGIKFFFVYFELHRYDSFMSERKTSYIGEFSKNHSVSKYLMC